MASSAGRAGFSDEINFPQWDNSGTFPDFGVGKSCPRRAAKSACSTQGPKLARKNRVLLTKTKNPGYFVATARLALEGPE
jgi:hypothetical protein